MTIPKVTESRQTSFNPSEWSESPERSNGRQKAAQAPKKAKGRQKKSPATLVDALTKKHIGQLARGLTEIAELNGGEGAQFNRANKGLNELIKGLQGMREGKK